MNLDRYMTIPFADDGRGFDGCNCWGLLRLVYENELGIDLPDYATVAADDTRSVARAVAEGKRAWRLVASRDGADPATWPAPPGLRDFDMVVARALDRPSRRMTELHVGLWLGGMILHTEHATGPVAIPPTDPRIRCRITEYRRHNALAH